MTLTGDHTLQCAHHIIFVPQTLMRNIFSISLEFKKKLSQKISATEKGTVFNRFRGVTIHPCHPL